MQPRKPEHESFECSPCRVCWFGATSTMFSGKAVMLQQLCSPGRTDLQNSKAQNGIPSQEDCPKSRLVPPTSLTDPMDVLRPWGLHVQEMEGCSNSSVL